MKAYDVIDRETGVVLGTYCANTPAAAITALLRDCGYKDADSAWRGAFVADEVREVHR